MFGRGASSREMIAGLWGPPYCKYIQYAATAHRLPSVHGGEGGIRTLDAVLPTYPLAGAPRPLGHSSVRRFTGHVADEEAKMRRREAAPASTDTECSEPARLLEDAARPGRDGRKVCAICGRRSHDLDNEIEGAGRRLPREGLALVQYEARRQPGSAGTRTLVRLGRLVEIERLWTAPASSMYFSSARRCLDLDVVIIWMFASSLNAAEHPARDADVRAHADATSSQADRSSPRGGGAGQRRTR